MKNPDRTIELFSQFDKKLESISGDSGLFERAVGTYFVGRRVGWKILYIWHDRKTLKKYEEILGISFRDEFEEFGDLAKKTAAYKGLKLVTNFWKAIKGEIPFERSALMGK